MNKFAVKSAAVLAGAAFVLGAGAGVASAQDQTAPVNDGTVPIQIVGNTGGVGVDPVGLATNFGFGSLGTESLATTLSTAMNELWILGSLTIPNATGLNAVPGSTGSYQTTPFFGSGQTLMGSAAGSLQGS